jgi:hypothetical protein
VALWAASAKANPGQCASGAPLRTGDGIVWREWEGLNILMDSEESGCLSMWPRYLIRASDLLIEEGTHVGRTRYARERRKSLEQGESVGERTRW